ncbi:exodeoxyribonuclease 7 large subunit [Galliscardovia ingluviei]|uniref:Exodeoxyribonuclease 7 large subunit n=1 Tax=Galliscardovia ingluviei TaxID=1769422 RepID=A0A8J3EXC0_9BIFI|nr:exodeoxyribonuclease VII large subunit [Galliscardovia ingluviei]GGI12694.1 exodeoxyribonuclease 7 large subunit [Galliscardovia ingluviei]
MTSFAQPQSTTPQGTQPLPRLARDTTAENPWPVALLSQKYHDAVAKWPGAWVEGQISEINTRRSGSAYLTVRDNTEDIAISVSGFGRFAVLAKEFRQGDRVVLHGRPDVWMKQTRLSFLADDIRRVGKGDLMAQIEALRKRLKGEGLFDADQKIPIPEFPHRIGLICAPHARAEGDVITNARLRWPTIDFVVVHAHVQGPNCPPDIIAAIAQLDADPSVDVIIVARGGGSFEDLMGFSDEGVVRAAAQCQTPIVSAIGHEDDWTLIDLAVDMRASTPTDAAKRVVPDVMEQWQLIEEAQRRIRDRIRSRVDNEIRLIEGYANRPSLTQPLTMLEKPQRFVDEARMRLDIAMRRLVDNAEATIERLHASVTALSPQSVLDRGYAVVQNEHGQVIKETSQVSEGETMHITIRSGMLTAQVQEIAPATTSKS